MTTLSVETEHNPVEGSERETALRRVARIRMRIVGTLTAVMLGIYLVILILMTLAPEVAALPLWPGASINVGLLAAVVLVVSGVVICSVYAMWTRRSLDPALHSLMQDFPS
jgi:uncharacterized membrane protein (DUF485 family)